MFMHCTEILQDTIHVHAYVCTCVRVHFRFCPDDMCTCYRTDVTLSKNQIRAQLEGGVVQPPRTKDSESRGIPPALVGIIAYSDSITSNKNQLVSFRPSKIKLFFECILSAIIKPMYQTK